MSSCEVHRHRADLAAEHRRASSAGPVWSSIVGCPTPAACTTPVEVGNGGEQVGERRPVGHVTGGDRHPGAQLAVSSGHQGVHARWRRLVVRSGSGGARRVRPSQRATTAPSAPVPPVTSTEPSSAAHTGRAGGVGARDQPPGEHTRRADRELVLIPGSTAQDRRQAGFRRGRRAWRERRSGRPIGRGIPAPPPCPGPTSGPGR